MTQDHIRVRRLKCQSRMGSSPKSGAAQTSGIFASLQRRAATMKDPAKGTISWEVRTKLHGSQRIWIPGGRHSEIGGCIREGSRQMRKIDKRARPPLQQEIVWAQWKTHKSNGPQIVHDHMQSIKETATHVSDSLRQVIVVLMMGERAHSAHCRWKLIWRLLNCDTSEDYLAGSCTPKPKTWCGLARIGTLKWQDYATCYGGSSCTAFAKLGSEERTCQRTALIFAPPAEY